MPKSSYLKHNRVHPLTAGVSGATGVASPTLVGDHPAGREEKTRAEKITADSVSASAATFASTSPSAPASPPLTFSAALKEKDDKDKPTLTKTMKKEIVELYKKEVKSFSEEQFKERLLRLKAALRNAPYAETPEFHRQLNRFKINSLFDEYINFHSDLDPDKKRELTLYLVDEILNENAGCGNCPCSIS